MFWPQGYPNQTGQGHCFNPELVSFVGVEPVHQGAGKVVAVDGTLSSYHRDDGPFIPIAFDNQGVHRAKRDDRFAPSPKRVCRENGFPLRSLCGLRVSAVNLGAKTVHRRDAESAEDAQSSFLGQPLKGRAKFIATLVH